MEYSCLVKGKRLPCQAFLPFALPHIIEDCLVHEHDLQFRKHLFEIVREQELIANS